MTLVLVGLNHLSLIISIILNKRGEKINPAHVAAGFQASVVEVLTTKALKAAKEYDVKQVIAAGGVAANKGLRSSLEEVFKNEEIPFYVPPIALCTDNAAMIAAAGSAMFAEGIRGTSCYEWQAWYATYFME